MNLVFCAMDGSLLCPVHPAPAAACRRRLGLAGPSQPEPLEAAHVRSSPEGGARRGGLPLSGSLLSRVPTPGREAAVPSRERRHLVAAVQIGRAHV